LFEPLAYVLLKKQEKRAQSGVVGIIACEQRRLFYCSSAEDFRRFSSPSGPARLLIGGRADELRTFPMTSAPAIRSLVLFDSGD
jgi:hypothetical protein